MKHARVKGLERAAERQGLRVEQSGRGEDERFWLVDPSLEAVAVGGEEGMMIYEIEAYLAQANKEIDKEYLPPGATW